MDSQEDTEPRKFFSFHGSITKINGKELEVQTQELMGGSVPRATYKFLAEGEETLSVMECDSCCDYYYYYYCVRVCVLE